MTTTERVYEAILTLYEDGDELPTTIREIQGRTGINSTSNVRFHVLKLVDAGRIRMSPTIARSIRPAREHAA